jgi:DNA-binding response OmpR family regulator
MDAQTQPALRSDLRARVRALRGELQVQRDRLNDLIEACQLTTSRRAAAGDGAPRLFARDLVRLGAAEVLVARQAIRHSGSTQRLTPTEWQLLAFLLAHPSVPHTRVDLAAGAWGPGFAERNSEVEVYVSRLRRKLGPAGALLETVRGRGYRLLLEPRVGAGNGTEPRNAADPMAAAPATSQA